MSTIGKIKVGGTTYDLARPIDAYPVGSIYLSVNDTSPAEFFGGTWERLKDRFLLAAGDTYPAGSKGGEAQHKLTGNEIPAHNHSLLSGSPSDTFKEGMMQATPNHYYSFAAYKIDNKYYWVSNTEFSGKSAPHNNMPPYLAVYVWKRIA